MSHMTRKKKERKAKNDLLRVYNPMNTGTRNMGFKSNNERKACLHMRLAFC